MADIDGAVFLWSTAKGAVEAIAAFLHVPTAPADAGRDVPAVRRTLAVFRIVEQRYRVAEIVRFNTGRVNPPAQTR
jgi:hypothetical protein